MAYTTINKPTDHVISDGYTGTSGNINVNIGFQPDLIWIKNKNNGYNHVVVDSVRGNTKVLEPSTSDAEGTCTEGVTAINSTGYTIGANTSSGGFEDDFNGTYNSPSYASWNWKGGTTSGITTNGSTTITPSSYSFNQSAGISIVKYTGNATAGAKVAHGLGAVPGLIFVKVLDTSNNWAVYHKEMGADNAMYLDQDTGKTDDPWMNDTAPDNVNFTLSGGNYGNTANAHVAYCFSQVDGFSSFGKYTGNGNTDGKFCYTGFKPAIVLCKRTNGTSSGGIFDNKRDPLNTVNKTLFPNSATSEDSSTVRMDFLSNGFKHRTTDTAWNGSSDEYIWIAFASEPIVGTNPATAY